MEVQNADEAGAQTGSTLKLSPGEDQELLGRVFSCYTKQLYRTAFRVLRSREDAEDAVQDGLLAAVRNLKSFEGRSQLSTWLTRVVFNAALMRLRKTRGHATTSIDQEGPDEQVFPLAARIADPRPDPEEQYAQEERLEILKTAVGSLPAPYRSAFSLRHIEGMTTQEAAVALGLSEGSLKCRLHRARLQVAGHIHNVPRHYGDVSTDRPSAKPLTPSPSPQGRGWRGATGEGSRPDTTQHLGMSVLSQAASRGSRCGKATGRKEQTR